MKTKYKILDSPCDYLEEDIPEEIDFSDGIPNPFCSNETINIELDSDIARYFKTSKEVNRVLRAVIHSNLKTSIKKVDAEV
ncbi:MAG TPA: hypothetical protein PKY56_12820 [Candidatus Kapabacteria bacterium]|nr:hypothetical protein [Candidatus Kapabacteria bacterium]HPO63064.1 hypothetical protein [Candidatus Kapabacteria bacterium]